MKDIRDFLIGVVAIGVVVAVAWSPCYYMYDHTFGPSSVQRRQEINAAIEAEGRRAAEAGIPADACHYSVRYDSCQRSLWMRGYQSNFSR